MVKVILLKSSDAKTIIVSQDTTIKKAWEEAFGAYNGERLMANCVPVAPDSCIGEYITDIDKPFYISYFKPVDNA